MSDIRRYTKTVIIDTIEKNIGSGLMAAFYPVISDTDFTNERVLSLISTTIELAEMYAYQTTGNVHEHIAKAAYEASFLFAATHVVRENDGTRFFTLAPAAQQEAQQWMQVAAQLDAAMNAYLHSKQQNPHGTINHSTNSVRSSGRRYISKSVQSAAAEHSDSDFNYNDDTTAVRNSVSRYRGSRIMGSDNRTAAPKNTDVSDKPSTKPKKPIVSGTIYIYDPTQWSSHYVPVGDKVKQELVRGANVLESDHLFGSTYVVSPKLAPAPVDFFGIYSNQKPVSINDNQELMFEAENVISDQLITATSRHHADVIFMGMLIDRGVEIAPNKMWQYHLCKLSIPFMAANKESFDATMSKTSLDRLVYNSNLDTYTTLSQLASVINEVGGLQQYPLNQKIAGYLDAGLTREINHFLRYHLEFDITISSFASNWDELLDYLTKNKSPEVMEHIMARLHGENGWNSYTDVIAGRALNIIPGSDIDSSITGTFNRFITTTKKHVQTYSLYCVEKYLVVHLPITASGLKIEFDQQQCGLLRKMYAPELYTLVDNIFIQRSQDEAPLNKVLLVTSDNVEILVDYTSLVSHVEDDIEYLQYLLTRL
jgi:hypothetical protein